MHSTFLDTGLQGIWTWNNWYASTSTGANQAWEGGAGSWSSGATVIYNVYIDWQGALCDLNATITGANFAPKNTTDTCDLVDLVLGINGDQTTDPYTLGRDPEYNQILSFRNGNAAVIFGIHRPDTSGGGGVIVPKAVENTLFLGYTLNYTSPTIAWSQIVETSPGIGFGADWMDYGIGIQWMNSTCKLYVNREYIGSLTISKAGFNTGIRAIETQVHTQQLVGLMRWLQRTDGEWFETNRMLGKNGTDPYYP
jgi:hypothetical protein